jgi:hypothetical protein
MTESKNVHKQISLIFMVQLIEQPKDRGANKRKGIVQDSVNIAAF